MVVVSSLVKETFSGSSSRAVSLRAHDSLDSSWTWVRTTLATLVEAIGLATDLAAIALYVGVSAALDG